MIYTEDGILTELETQLSSKSNWRQTLFHGVYRRINVVIAYVINKLVYLCEFLYKESNWDQATQIESLMARTEYYWYNPYRMVGASGNIVMSASPTFSASYTYTGESVSIPQWSQFSDADKEVFVYCTEDTIYYKNTVGSIDIPVKEGVPKQYLYTAYGNDSEQITLNFDNIDNAEVYVYIVDSGNNILYTVTRCENDVDTKLFFIEDLVTYHCSIKNSLDMASVIITFGDGVKSRKLALNDRVLIKYAETKGALGNITNSDTITNIYSTLLDANGDEVVLYVNNTENITNGSDVESIESIRYNATNLFSSAYRCGGYDDWKAILEADARIYLATIWSTDDFEDDTLTINQNKIYVTAIGVDGEALSSATQNDITVNTLKPIKSPTELVSWQTLKKIYARFSVEAVVDSLTFTASQLQINEALDETYGTLYTDFKTNIYESNFYSVINDLSFIINHVTSLTHMEKDITYAQTNYVIVVSKLSTEDSDTKNQVYLVPGSVELWIRTKVDDEYIDPVRVAYESGSALIGDNGYTISSTSIVHATNEISYIVDDLTGVSTDDYELVLVYSTKDGDGKRTNDIRLPGQDMITDFDEAYNVFDLSYE
jgi:hypothetical protein